MNRRFGAVSQPNRQGSTRSLGTSESEFRGFAEAEKRKNKKRNNPNYKFKHCPCKH